MVSPPTPIPGVSKSLLPGANKLEKNMCLMIVYNFYGKSKKYPARGLKKGSPQKQNKRRFPEGVQREEIQQWRQARPRPGEKETLNIMLRGISVP